MKLITILMLACSSVFAEDMNDALQMMLRLQGQQQQNQNSNQPYMRRNRAPMDEVYDRQSDYLMGNTIPQSQFPCQVNPYTGNMVCNPGN